MPPKARRRRAGGRRSAQPVGRPNSGQRAAALQLWGGGAAALRSRPGGPLLLKFQQLISLYARQPPSQSSSCSLFLAQRPSHPSNSRSALGPGSHFLSFRCCSPLSARHEMLEEVRETQDCPVPRCGAAKRKRCERNISPSGRGRRMRRQRQRQRQAAARPLARLGSLERGCVAAVTMTQGC